jgi:hypothetical protein
VFLSGVNVQVIFALNGAVLGYLFIVLFPIIIHFKCIYFDRSGGTIEDNPEWNSQLVPNDC